MTNTPNLVLLALDDYEEKDFSGRIYTRYDREPISFGSSLSLLWELEKCYDRWNLPGNDVCYRDFRDQRKRKARTKAIHRSAGFVEKILDLPPGPLPEVEGQLATILVECQQRLHVDWSGRYWLGTMDTETEFRKFDSTLEFLRQLDQYISSRTRRAGMLWQRRSLHKVI